MRKKLLVIFALTYAISPLKVTARSEKYGYKKLQQKKILYRVLTPLIEQPFLPFLEQPTNTPSQMAQALQRRMRSLQRRQPEQRARQIRQPRNGIVRIVVQTALRYLVVLPLNNMIQRHSIRKRSTCTIL